LIPTLALRLKKGESLVDSWLIPFKHYCSSNRKKLREESNQLAANIKALGMICL